MGFWGINSNVGNIIALVLCNILDQTNKMPWTSNFLVTGGLTVGIGLICLIFLQEKPLEKKNQLLYASQITSKHEEG